jgi:hypothetical protein
LVSLSIQIHLVDILVSSLANYISALSNVPEVYYELYQTDLSDTKVVSYTMSSTLRVQALYVVLNVCINVLSFCSLDFTE